MPEALVRNVRRGMVDSMSEFQREMQGRMRDPVNGVARRNGALSRSFHQTVTNGGNISDLVGTAAMGGTSAPYARLQEFGGTVRPNKKKFLAVPTPQAFTKGGRLKQNLVGFLGSIPKVFVVKSKQTGRLVALQRVSKKKVIAIATLRESVTVRPRLGFYDTWKKLSKSRMDRMRSAVMKTLRGEK